MFPNLDDPRILVWWIVFLMAASWALARGAAPERAVALFALYMVLVQGLSLGIVPPEFDELDNTALLADSILVAAVTSVAFVANRTWPLLAAAITLFSLSSHFSRAVIPGPELMGYAYALTKTVPSLLVVILAAVGAERHQARSKKFGKYRNWRLPIECIDNEYDLSPYSIEWRLAAQRSRLEIPLLICGGLITLYCIYIAASSEPEAWRSVSSVFFAIVLAIGIATFAGGVWFLKHERKERNEAIERFKEAHC